MNLTEIEIRDIINFISLHSFEYEFKSNFNLVTSKLEKML